MQISIATCHIVEPFPYTYLKLLYICYDVYNTKTKSYRNSYSGFSDMCFNHCKYIFNSLIDPDNVLFLTNSPLPVFIKQIFDIFIKYLQINSAVGRIVFENNNLIIDSIFVINYS